MENQDICHECQKEPVKWYCIDHQIYLCIKCSFKSHEKCSKTKKNEEKILTICQQCKQKYASIYCNQHFLQLCDECYYQNHKGCNGILMEQFEKEKSNFIDKLKSTKIKEFESFQQVKKLELFKLNDKIVKNMAILKDELNESKKILEQSVDQQLQQVDIKIDNQKTTSVTEVYIENSFNILRKIWEETTRGTEKVNQELLNVIQTISKIRQTQLNEKQEKKVLERQNDNYPPSKDKCKYILPENSSQVCGHTLIYCKTTKKLLAAGDNRSGQLCNKPHTNQLQPIAINQHFINQQIKQIACGNQHSIILTNMGLYTFGSNKEGQLGNGTTKNSFIPVNIISKFNGEVVKFVACGCFHNVVVTSKNQIYVFGQNGNGQLGDKSNEKKLIPINITSNVKRTIIANNQVLRYDDWNQLDQIVSASCGCFHTIIQTNNSLFVCGSNEKGQLGLGEQQVEDQLFPVSIDHMFAPETKFVQAKCGYYHTVVLTDKGLFTFGFNEEGALGINSFENAYTPVNITKLFANESILSVDCGFGHTIIQTDKQFYSIGRNDYCQLGIGPTTNQSLPQKIKLDLTQNKVMQFVCLGNHNFIETDKGLYGFGLNAFNQLGIKQTQYQQVPDLVDQYFQ